MNKTFQRILLIFFIFIVAPLRAATLAVVYPKTNKTSGAVYQQIIDGIKQEFDGSVILIEVPKKLDRKALAAIAASIEQKKPDMVIALGGRGRKVCRLFKSKIPWVSGASTSRSKGISGITPIADPDVMFAKLKTLSPKVKRIFVVYSKRNKWLIDLAKKSAAGYGLEMLTYPIKDRAAAMILYNKLIKESVKKNDAIWLPHDKKSADPKYALPLLLNAAWERRFVVFSSRLDYVRRGVLFSLLPDNLVTGSQLVKMVQGMHKESTVPGVKTTTVVKLAVNLRTASHLGLVYTTKQKGQFHLTFPTH
ncbi:MAG: hypothetical protein HRT35_35430 [Algicola sp.]|nr:hypothetical protein [Algicola sp.]